MQSLKSATIILAALPLLACVSTSSGDGSSSGGGGSTSASSSAGGGSASSGVGGGSACAADDMGPDEVLPDASDPEAGMFTLDEALVDLPAGPGPLRAIVKTDFGDISCELLDTAAPGAVANFVGLARGRRPWLDPASGKWVKRRYYDGLAFHRVIPDFMIQGGDPLGTGTGGPGYTINDELAGLSHEPGTLSFAKSSAPNSQGSQFFITESAQTHLDADFTIFGRCKPIDVVTTITGQATDANDKPLTPVLMKEIEITRCAP